MIMITVRKTAPEDIAALGALFDEARGTMAALGIDQWQAGYPNASSAEEDRKLNRGYVLEREGEICGTVALVFPEPTYRIIENGRWLTGDDGNYLALHRVAVAVNHRGTGVAEAILNHSEKVAKEQGKISLRIDTHRGNLPMRRMLERNGFTHCGRIRLANGDPREAYEKII